MWIYYEDKGQYIGMTKTKHKAVETFIKDAIRNDEVVHIKTDVQLPNLSKKYKLDVYFDIPSFLNKINLDCLNCEHVHDNRSCCGGSPFPFDVSSIEEILTNGSLIPYVREEFRGNLRMCQIEKTVDYVYSHTKRTFIPNINSEGIKECPLRGYDRCGIHAYILDCGLPYYTKPCTWMYPFDCLIELDEHLIPKAIYSFMLCERTSEITRWGSTSYKRHCLDENLNDEIEEYEEPYYHQYTCDKKKYFKKNDYKPSFLCYDSEIRYLFGDKIAKMFQDSMQKRYSEGK